MVGALSLVDRCFNLKLRGHDCVSMFREILYRSNSTADLFPCLHTRRLGDFSIVLQTFDGDLAYCLSTPPRDCDKINDYKLLR